MTFDQDAQDTAAFDRGFMREHRRLQQKDNYVVSDIHQKEGHALTSPEIVDGAPNPGTTRYLIPESESWIMMPEAVPPTRARLKDGDTAPLILWIDDEGAIHGDLDSVVLDTTMEG